jgi:ACS family tartrate transporter-like MFS transporter
MVSASALLQALVGTGTLEDAHERRIFGRVTWRLVPFLFLCYVVAYIDRLNVSFAADDMQRDLGMSTRVYGIGGALFFVGYCLFEIPSNLVLERVGARRWIARIMIVWGLVSMAMMWVQGGWSFYAMRVLLGLAEAGFFPGVVLYLTYWIPARQRAKTGALFMMAAAFAAMTGPWIAAALLSLNGKAGLRGWQWLFIVEGLPAIVLGLVSLRWLTDRPEQADWLPPEDREWLSQEMAREREERLRAQTSHGFQALRDPKVLLLCLIYFMNTFATYGVFLFLPKILRQSCDCGGFKLAAFSSAPFVMALLGMVVIGWNSDRTQERKWHVAVCAFTAAIGLLLATHVQHSVLLVVLSVTISQLTQRAIQGVFWAIPPIFLGGTAAAAGIAMINAVGNLGGAAGSWIVGVLRQGSNDYTTALLALAAALVLEGLLVLSLRLPRRATAR